MENKAANFAAFAVLKCGFFIAKLFFFNYAKSICGKNMRNLRKGFIMKKEKIGYRDWMNQHIQLCGDSRIKYSLITLIVALLSVLFEFFYGYYESIN